MTGVNPTGDSRAVNSGEGLLDEVVPSTDLSTVSMSLLLFLVRLRDINISPVQKNGS
jgi:hypothetical protein